MRYLAILLCLFSICLYSQKEDENSKSSSQNSILAVKVFSEDGETLIGATIKLTSKSDNQIYGGYTNRDGILTIKDIVPKEYQINISYIGYQTVLSDIEVPPGANLNKEYTLLGGAIRSKTIQVVADRAKFRETPIAFSEISKEDIELKLGGDDIPLILNETPGAYATRNGQGFGESRINIRGFKQRNLAVMINGVPVNDMENGRVFWSNWDGIGDVTASQQVQRGLGASKIANPSVGGTMNIITDAAQRKPGLVYRQQYGFFDQSVDNFQLLNNDGEVIYDKPFNSNFLQSRLIFNTGLIDKFAMTVALSRKVGEGPTDATWIDAYSYYVGLSYDLSDKHYLDFYLYGAPQVRGRKAWRLPVAAYDAEIARDLGISEESIAQVELETGTNYGRFHNPNWGYMERPASLFNGPERTLQLDDNSYDWHYSDKLNQYHNFYHKPHATLNWYWQINDVSALTTVVYLSTGNGGGTSIFGPQPGRDIYGTNLLLLTQSFEANFSNIDDSYSLIDPRSEHILGASVNNHFWTGALTTYERDFDNNLKIQTGLDFRYYEGEHYRMIAHTLGSQRAYFVETQRVLDPNSPEFGEFRDTTGNDNIANDRSQWQRRLGDKITYDYIGYVTMIGGFFQLEKRWKDLTYYFNTSAVNSIYKREDFFRLPENRIANSSHFGYTIKTGLNYNINDNFNIYSNNGYFERPPFFNSVFTNNNAVIDGVTNEKILGLELGLGYRNDDRNFESTINTYYTNWLDQTRTYFPNLGGEDTDNYLGVLMAQGQDALHTGIEWEVYYKPFRQIWFRSSLSLGNWEWTSNPDLIAIDDRVPLEFRNYPIDQVPAQGLKVGDAPQRMFFLSATWLPLRNFNRDALGDFSNLLISASFKYNWEFYTDFNPEALTNYINIINDPSNGLSQASIPQAWELPAFWTLNLFVSYRFYDVLNWFNMDLKFRVNNITDNIYVSDANFRNPVRAFVNENGQIDGNFNRPDEAEVHLGFPRQYNIELKIDI